MNDEPIDEFNDRLWDAWNALVKREKGNVSQARVAEKIRELSGQKTRQDDISRWLKARGRPSYEELPAVGQAFGVSHYWLAFNEGPMILERAPEQPALIAKDKDTRVDQTQKKRKGA